MEENEQTEPNERKDKNDGEVTYLANVKICFGLLLMIVDFASDISILISLFKRGYFKLFSVGLFIDLLPGPITAFHMTSRGYGLKSATLLVHPVNVVVQSFLAFCNASPEKARFHRKVLLFAKEIQGLLESPLQIIFTMTLIAHGILPLPWETTLEYETSFGIPINLSFLPSLSVFISMSVIIFNSSETVILMEYIKKCDSESVQKCVSWIFYFAAMVLFRLEVWTLLSVYFAEFVVVIILALSIVNFLIFYFLQKEINFDPFLGSVLSLIFPTAYTRTTHNVETIQSEMEFNKKAHMLLALIGNGLLLTSLWTLYFILDKLPYHSHIIINRERFIAFILATTAMGIISLSSTLFIKTMSYCAKNCYLSLITVTVTTALLAAAISIFSLQFLLGTLQTEYDFTVCSKNISIKAERFGNSPAARHYEWIETCEDDFEGFFGCLIDEKGQKVGVIIDEKPSSALPKKVNRTAIVLIRKHSESEKILKDMLDIRICSTALMIVGGFQGNTAKGDVEMIDMSGDNKRCRKPPDYKIKFDSTGAFFDGFASVCGGGNTTLEGVTLCYKYDTKRNEWVPIPDMTTARQSPASILLRNGDWWITGGKPGRLSSEVLQSDHPNEFKPRQSLPENMSGHTMIELNRTAVLLVGNDDASVNAYIYDIPSETFSLLPKMKTARRDPQAGLVTNPETGSQKLVVCGGWNYGFADNFKTTEELDLQTLRWQSGPDLPQPITNGASVQLKKTFWIVGGFNQTKPINTIYQYDGDSNQWILREEKLTRARSSFAAFFVPDDVADCY